MKIELGYKVQDVASRRKGLVVGHATYAFGSDSYQVLRKNGSSFWIQGSQLYVIDNEIPEGFPRTDIEDARTGSELGYKVQDVASRRKGLVVGKATYAFGSDSYQVLRKNGASFWIQGAQLTVIDNEIPEGFPRTDIEDDS